MRVFAFSFLLLMLFAPVLFAPEAFAQEEAPVFRKELSFTGGNRSMLPFWVTANQFGVVPHNRSSAAFRIAVTQPLKQPSRIGFAYGIDAVVRAGEQSTAFLQQLYGELTWGPFLLRAGRKEEKMGEVHPFLTTGSMVLSGNAAPVIGISISWPSYVTVPRTGTFLAIKGHAKHGWLDGNRITTNPMLHAKSLFMRFGKDQWPWKAWAGVMHYNVWGGRHKNENIGDLPRSFNDFLRVFFIQGANSTFEVDGEVTNVLGNSIGAYDVGFSWEAASFFLQFYRQFYLEDTVSTRLRSPGDGLYGLHFKASDREGLLSDVLYEHINTRKQGSKRSEIQGTDNYYNHFIYSTGWTHRGRTLGTPVILMRPDQVGVFNNMLFAHHLGIAGTLRTTTAYQVLLTMTRNYGVNSIFRSTGFGFTMDGARFDGARDQFYAGLTIFQSLPNMPQFQVMTRLGYDWGDVRTDNNFGLTVGVVHTNR
ncbi:MAG: capsule assembly Wzi family protein [Bacteroidota bacterium]